MADIIVQEGTWTPTLYGSMNAGTASYLYQEGYYVRIGNMVTITARVDAQLSGATGVVYLGGAPFDPKMMTAGSIHSTVNFTSTTINRYRAVLEGMTAQNYQGGGIFVSYTYII